MDPLTHGLTGAAAAHIISREKDAKFPFIIGAISAQIPDVDVIFQSTADPLTAVELHRHFTHSLLFAPIGSLIGAIVFFFFLKDKFTFGKLYGMVLAAYLAAVLLDACTSYGTHLLWPLLDREFAWNLVSVVDPVITLGMIFLVAYSTIKKNKKGSFLAIGWLIMFIFYGLIQNQRASEFAGNYVHQEMDITIDKSVVKPTIGNQLLWRYTFIADDSVHTLGVRAGLFKGMKVYPGEVAEIRRPEDSQFQNLSENKRRDVRRFYELSDGYMIDHPDDDNVLGDARYSMLPTSLIPLWGIDISGDDGEDVSPFLYFRDSGREIRKSFLNMLLAKDVE